jgi:hypothetical protein
MAERASTYGNFAEEPKNFCFTDLLTGFFSCGFEFIA